jgi:hypothetical protein
MEELVEIYRQTPDKIIPIITGTDEILNQLKV